MTTLSAMARLLAIKSEHHISERGYNEIIKFMKDCLPNDNSLVENFYATKRLMRGLGLPVEKFICPTLSLLWELLPERLGDPDCPLLLENPKMLIGFRCKFNHPKDKLNSLVVDISLLPERPSEPPCSVRLGFTSCAPCKVQPYGCGVGVGFLSFKAFHISWLPKLYSVQGSAISSTLKLFAASFCVHNGIVRGLRWLGNSRLVSFSYTLANEKVGGYNNKLVVTRVRSGLNRIFRVMQKPERAPIRALRASSSGRSLALPFTVIGMDSSNGTETLDKISGLNVTIAPNGEGYLWMFFSHQNGHALTMPGTQKGVFVLHDLKKRRIMANQKLMHEPKPSDGCFSYCSGSWGRKG
ncbi:hypothetical protein Syun_007343 [Stephania yunnanensis]|uniref:WDR11 second beta-propeller domain-containing protein n=1 Tax=Stephania yunnanensis TaxID=152371 RepID=A0AAP0PYF7_9MAGN